MIKTIIKEGFFWNTIRKDCDDFRANCVTCNTFSQRNKRIGITPIISDFPMQRLHMDLLEFTTELKAVYVLNLVDHFSKYAWSFFDGKKEGEEINDNVMRFFSMNPLHPQIVQRDNGGEFVHKINDILKKIL